MLALGIGCLGIVLLGIAMYNHELQKIRAEIRIQERRQNEAAWFKNNNLDHLRNR